MRNANEQPEQHRSLRGDHCHRADQYRADGLPSLNYRRNQDLIAWSRTREAADLL
jgi:hypothetical protein